MSVLATGEFWQGVFSEPEDGPSFSRIATGILVLASIFWITYVVVKTRAIPDLSGVALFIMALYGANKFTTAITKFAGPK